MDASAATAATAAALWISYICCCYSVSTFDYIESNSVNHVHNACIWPLSLNRWFSAMLDLRNQIECACLCIIGFVQFQIHSHKLLSKWLKRSTTTFVRIHYYCFSCFFRRWTLSCLKSCIISSSLMTFHTLLIPIWIRNHNVKFPFQTMYFELGALTFEFSTFKVSNFEFFDGVKRQNKNPTK